MKITIIILMLIVTNSQANLSQDIECSAIYSGLAVGLNKKGKHELSQKIQTAGKLRTQRVVVKLGKKEGHSKIIHSVKTIRQKYTDDEFNALGRECIKEDGI